MIYLIFPVFLLSQHTANYVESGYSVLNVVFILYKPAARRPVPDAESHSGDSVLNTKSSNRNSDLRFSLAQDADSLKTPFYGSVLMGLIKTLLTLRYVRQLGADHLA